ncbi:MAG: hypothetical protein GY719_14270 [bacterium]|nr:hypothetical protein [bacterium]
MSDFFSNLAPYLGLIGVLLFVLALLATWQLYRFARGIRVRPPGPYDEPTAGDEATADVIDLTRGRSSSGLKRSFASVRQSLRTMLPGAGSDYRRPWVLALGQSRAGKTTLLGRTGLGLRYGQPGPTAGDDDAGINWWAFDSGMVLDVVGDDVLRHDGRTSDRAAWRGLLRQIRRSRPRRPIDAVLLTLPASELVDANKPVAQRLAEASRRAAILHHKLAQAQTTLGVSVPIYVLVSRCDLLPGFGTLPASLSPWRRQQMLGWSAPHSPRTTYSGAWIDRAFANVGDDLEAFQLEALAHGRQTGNVDDFVLFPGQLQELLEPLRVYCNHLFSPRAGVEPLLFRGLYFCGSTEPAAAETTADGARELLGATPDVAFVGDLLEHKIFPEAGLARPTERADFAARTRRAGLAAVTAVGLLWLLFGLWPAARSVTATAGSLEPSVERITGELEGLRRDEPRRVTPASVPPDQTAREVLDAASEIETLRLRSVRLPASWLSPLPGRVRGSIEDSFREIVFPAIRASLAGRAESLAAAAPPALRSPPRGIPAVATLPEFQDLDRFTREIEALEQRIEQYRPFSGPPARGQNVLEQVRGLTAALGGGQAAGNDLLREFNELSATVLRKQLRPATPGARRAYVRMLHGARAPSFEYDSNQLDERLTARVKEYADALFDTLFDHHPLDRELLEVSLDLARLTPLRAPSNTEVEAYRELLDNLRQVQSDLELPAVQNLAADRPTLGRKFDQVLFRIHSSRFLGPELAIEIRDRARSKFLRLQSILLGFETPYTGSLLQREQGALKIREPVAEIQNALTVLLSEPFMKPRGGRTLRAEPPADRVFYWRGQPLSEAMALFASYQAYSAPDGNLDKFLKEQDLESLPEPLRGTESSVSRDTVAANILDLIAKAQELDPVPAGATPEALERGVRAQVQNLQTVEQDLETLMGHLARLDHRTDSERVALLLHNQRIGILDQLDQLLERLAPYRPRDGGFAWWNGVEPAAPAAFGVDSAGDLAGYLADERQTVARLSGEYAQPLLNLFQGSRRSALRQAPPQTTTWNKIAVDLSDYANGSAGNPVSTLEALITGDLAEIKLWDAPETAEDDGSDENGNGPQSSACFERLSPTTFRSPAADFFRSRGKALQQQLYERCLRLADEQGYRRYARLASFFNVKLARNFPFSASRSRTDVDPETIRAFFEQDFERTHYLIANLPDPSRQFGDRREAVQEFMEQMAAVRAFFDGFLAEDAEVKVPVYDLDVRFRVMRASEAGANQILRWNLLIEDQRIDLLGTRSDRPDQPKTPELPAGRWVWDETPNPLRLAVRWASGSPFSPQAAKPVERVRIEGKTITFTYREPWALLRLLKEHPTPPQDFPTLRDPRPETIKLEIVTVSDDDPERRATATLYSRIVLLDPTTKNEMTLPAFPAFAPDFEIGSVGASP